MFWYLQFQMEYLFRCQSVTLLIYFNLYKLLKMFRCSCLQFKKIVQFSYALSICLKNSNEGLNESTHPLFDACFSGVSNPCKRYTAVAQQISLLKKHVILISEVVIQKQQPFLRKCFYNCRAKTSKRFKCRLQRVFCVFVALLHIDTIRYIFVVLCKLIGLVLEKSIL